MLEELYQFFRRFKRGDDLAPIEERDEWEKLVSSQYPEQQELLNELVRFADLFALRRANRQTKLSVKAYRQRPEGLAEAQINDFESANTDSTASFSCASKTSR